MRKQGIYVHIPYCGSKCLYCDFFSGGARGVDWARLVMALRNELSERLSEIHAPGAALSTLYIGGGTPSLVPAVYFRSLVDGINDITYHDGSWDEFTIEVNPEDVTHDTCQVWRDSGVNRVSMGIQSFLDEELKTIGRRHTAEKAISSFNILRQHFDNISIDLMFGLPGQTLESWRRSVTGALKLNPEHISAYSLMFEEGTAMTVLREQGRLSFPGEEDCVEMWRILSEELAKAGYVRYEISNYAKPGRESIHNRRYWLGNPYLGIGPSAHSYDGDSTRRSNPPHLREYLERYAGDDTSKDGCSASPYQEKEILTDEELKEEYIMLRMRMSEGIFLPDFREKFGDEALKRLLRNAMKADESGNLVISDNCICLSSEGVMKSDDIIVSLML